MFPLSCRRKPRSTRMQLVDSGTWWGRSSVITMLHTCRHTCSEASSPGSSRWLRCSPSGSPCSPSDPRCRTEVWWRRSRLRSPGRERYLQMMSWGRGWEIIWKCVLNDGNKMSNDDSPPELKNEESLPVRSLRTDSERQAVSCVRVDVVECFLHGQSEQNQLAEVMPAVLTVLREGDRSEASWEKAERKQADVSWWCEDVLFTVNSSTGLYTFNPFKLKVWWSGDEQQPVCCWKTSMNELIINYRVAAVIWGVVLLTCRSGERPEAAMYELPMVFIFSTSWKKHSSSSCTDTQEWFSYWL